MAAKSSSKSKKVVEGSEEEDELEVQAGGDDQSDDGGDQGSEEEYDIEEIRDCERGHFVKGKWAYLVKWENYPESDNSWVKEEDFNAKDLIKAWWEKHPEIPGNPLFKHQSTSAAASSKAPSKVSRAGRKSVITSASPSVEPASSHKSSKRKSTAKEESVQSDHDVEMEDGGDDDVQPVKKKPKKDVIASSSKSSKHKKREEGTGTPEYFDINEETTESIRPHDGTVMEKYAKTKDWSSIVKQIDTVEATEDGPLMVYLTTRDDLKGIVDSKVMRRKAPEMLIEFYENHLRWKHKSEINGPEMNID